ncbi:hypothetical protein O2W14_00020 [Modestobacter sp. VKM Ac-2986]|uniref:hypothetical protein n=1 Tax=Modestobacter sp. VKM Ac-2986 TaxID=3004140 RepID=UPI0022AA741C|nr:hypothetical protein [Modestobacter sp. VKM Ac-2986]MCZ2827216.1 hypothetical protein [Modestobacter sp. VKM Ac-2986]
MTGLLFDGTFSTEAVASAGHALVEQLFDEAMATIAALAENWDAPVTEATEVEDDEPVALVEPASWSATDDDEDDVRALAGLALPVLLPRRSEAVAA